MTSTPIEKPPGRYWLDVANETQDPVSMTGAALCGLLAIQVEREEAEGKAAAVDSAIEEGRQLALHLETVNGALRLVIDDIVAAVKPSTSKLADKVRSIVAEALPPTPPTTEPVIEPPPAE